MCDSACYCAQVVIAQARQAAGTGTGTTLADRPISSGSSDLSRPLLDAEDPSGNGVIENAPQTYQDALERPAKGASVAVKIFKTAFKVHKRAGNECIVLGVAFVHHRCLCCLFCAAAHWSLHRNVGNE